MRILGLIPARGGSKGIPRKNIKLLAGKPLLQYTTEVALHAIRLDRIILSTEDLEIADIGRQLGVEVPFIRPSELAQDDTPTIDVVHHALRWLTLTGDTFDAVCLLQPTCPMRTSKMIDECVELFDQANADCVLTVLMVPDKYNPNWVYFKTEDGFLKIATGDANPISRRQDLPLAYHRDGSIYISRSSQILGNKTLFGSKVVGYLVDEAKSVNLDTEKDWELAETLISASNQQKS